MGVGKSTFAFSNSSITIDGGSTTIGITRDNQSYSHKLLHGYGDIATLAVGTTSYTYKPTASALTKFFQEVPAQKSRLIDIYLDTYNGSTKVGRDVHALTVTLSEATGKPDISDFSITDRSATGGLGIIVYGKSSLTATATPAGKYGATISRNVFTCDYNGKHYESYYINDLIASLPLTTTPSDFTIGYKSTDSRGFSNTVTLSKTIAEYQAPHIDTFEVVRCDESGNESDTGTHVKLVVKGSWAAMKVGTAYKNPATLMVGTKTKSAETYGYEKITVSGGTIDISQISNAEYDVNSDYVFAIKLTDSFETYTETGVGFSNVKNILYVSADGEEVVIGSDTGNNVAIDSDSVDIRDGATTLAMFSKDTIELGKNSKNATISFCDGSGRVNATKYTLDGEDFYGLSMTSKVASETVSDAINGHVSVSPVGSSIAVGTDQFAHASITLGRGGDVSVTGSTIQISSRIGSRLYDGPSVPLYTPWTYMYNDSNYGWLKYCVRMGICYIQWYVRQDTGARTWDVGTLPANCRPANGFRMAATQSGNTNNVSTIYVNSNGLITLWWPAAGWSEGMVSFPVG